MRTLKGTLDVIQERKLNVDERNHEVAELISVISVAQSAQKFYSEVIEELGENEFVNPAREAAMAAIAEAEQEAELERA